MASAMANSNVQEMMEKVSANLLMVESMKDFGKKDLSMVSATTSSLMEVSTEVNLKMVHDMVLEFMNLEMAVNTKENSELARKMVMENTSTLINLCTKVNLS